MLPNATPDTQLTPVTGAYSACSPDVTSVQAIGCQIGFILADDALNSRMTNFFNQHPAAVSWNILEPQKAQKVKDWYATCVVPCRILLRRDSLAVAVAAHSAMKCLR